MMKNSALLFLLLMMAGIVKAQDLKTKNVPAIVKSALAKKYPDAAKVSWEKEKGNY